MAKQAATVSGLGSSAFLVLCYDADGSAAARARCLDGHLDYVERHCEQYLVCGPLREPGQGALIGSFFLVAADSAAAARNIVDGDPYVQSGMYREILVHEAVPAAGRYLGGVIWESADDIRERAS